MVSAILTNSARFLSSNWSFSIAAIKAKAAIPAAGWSLPSNFISMIFYLPCLPMSRSVSKPLAGSATQRAIGAFFIVDPERHSVVMPKIELGQIPMQMMLGHVVVDADDAALEHAEIAFRGVGVPEVGANVLLGRMIHGA